MCRLIEQLESETDRAQSATKNIHKKLKTTVLQREQQSLSNAFY